jgi:metal-sulfur cluster biosynthetic enzyme
MLTKEQVIDALKLVVDPELFIDVWTLELIYGLIVKGDTVTITMTFTTPLCPYGPMLVEDVKEKIRSINGVNKVDVIVTFDPVWKPSDDLKEMLGVGF